ncbi:MAG: AAA family ATPase [Lachnospiraceae bacterium]|nr:AAA family ATPase [Lachnospiraceae bacterium]
MAILDSVREIDRVISNTNKNCCIFYFQSQNRKIIERAINTSTALRNFLGISSQFGNTENIFATLRRNGKCLNATECYQQTYSLGRFDFKEKPVFLYLSDFQVFSKEEDRVRFLKAFMDKQEEWEDKGKKMYLLLSSEQCLIPSGFSDYVELVREKALSENDLYIMLHNRVRQEEKKREKTYYTEEQIKNYAKKLVGLTEQQVESVFTKLTDCFCTEMERTIVDYINQEKRKEGEKDGTIEFIEVSHAPNMAGIGKYMEWLEDRERSLENPKEFSKKGMPAPKGVFLCGVPGTGKTELAKETAWRLHMNLIRFDIGKLSSKEYGSSEAKMEHFLNRVCANAPCVMLIDEIDKTFNAKNMHEVKLQQLNKLLGWMQSRKENVLTMITANNIENLPPELVRDGRIGGRFFAFMPTASDLKAILWKKLLPLAENGIFGGHFCMDIQKKCNGQDISSPIDDVFNRIVKMDDGRFTTRTPFLTGANLETLIEMANRALDKAGKLEGCLAKDYADQLVKCGRSKDFVPQGQSNLNDLVDRWLNIYENQYQEVSANPVLPFSCFIDRKFRDLPATTNAYDEYLQKTLKEKIEKKMKDIEIKEKAYEKLVNQEEK